MSWFKKFTKAVTSVAKGAVGSAIGGVAMGPLGSIIGGTLGLLGGGGGGGGGGPGAPVLPQDGGDLFDTAAVAARQRAARKMQDGLSGAGFATSARGLEGPLGAGLKPPPDSQTAGEPIITTMSGAGEQKFAAAQGQAAADAAKAAELERIKALFKGRSFGGGVLGNLAGMNSVSPSSGIAGLLRSGVLK